jgi:hypothetical protein
MIDEPKAGHPRVDEDEEQLRLPRKSKPKAVSL